MVGKHCCGSALPLVEACCLFEEGRRGGAGIRWEQRKSQTCPASPKFPGALCKSPAIPCIQQAVLPGGLWQLGCPWPGPHIPAVPCQLKPDLLPQGSSDGMLGEEWHVGWVRSKREGERPAAGGVESSGRTEQNPPPGPAYMGWARLRTHNGPQLCAVETKSAPLPPPLPRASCLQEEAGMWVQRAKGSSPDSPCRVARRQALSLYSSGS